MLVLMQHGRPDTKVRLLTEFKTFNLVEFLGDCPSLNIKSGQVEMVYKDSLKSL